MPVPKPKKNQKEQEFISDCMGDNVMNKDFPNQKQRYAVCKSTFDRARKSSASEDVSWEEERNRPIIFF